MDQETNKPLVIAVIITFVIAFWLGFLVGWLITGREGESALDARGEENETEEINTASEPEPISSTKTNGARNSLQASDQLAGGNVMVESVSLAREEWVVIHEDREGKPGNILGASWLPAGSHENIAVDLLRDTEPGRRYYAMLHHEVNGSENHLFDREKDLPLQDAQGNIIMVSFETIASPR